MRSHRKSRLSELIVFLAVVAFLVGIWYFGKHIHSIGSNTNRPAQQGAAQNAFNKSRYSVNDPASIWVVVNKGRVLPSAYVPADLVTPSIPLRTSGSEMQLRAEPAAAAKEMFASAAKEGFRLMLASGYRSYALQASLYSGYVKTQGTQSADASSARPGHSEHQTGLAADLEPASRTCEVDPCFANTPEGKWLAANAYKYGFIIRYQKGQENLTGYEFEPWHVRYVGKDLASQLHNSGQTLEQFFGLPVYSGYPITSFVLHSG